jgi:hypothetical protein
MNIVCRCLSRWVILFLILLVCERELAEKLDSALVSCYRSGACPGAEATLALIMSHCDSILGSESTKLLQHYQRLLGDDFPHVLARKLRNHVRKLVSEIIREAEERIQAENREAIEIPQAIRILQPSELKQQRKNENEADSEDSDSEESHDYYSQEMETDIRHILEDGDYYWLLDQLAVFLLSYSRLETFLCKQRNDTSENDGVKFSWPIVCLFPCFFS